MSHGIAEAQRLVESILTGSKSRVFGPRDTRVSDILNALSAYDDYEQARHGRLARRFQTTDGVLVAQVLGGAAHSRSRNLDSETRNSWSVAPRNSPAETQEINFCLGVPLHLRLPDARVQGAKH